MIWWLRKQFLRIKLYASENYQNEAESLIIWYAVCYAAGIAFYLAAPWELPIWLITAYLEAILILLYVYRQRLGIFKVLTYLIVFMLGVCFAKADALYRKSNIEKEIPEYSYISGQIEELHQGRSNNIILLLNHVDNFEKKLKGKYKISVRHNGSVLKIGRCVQMIAAFPRSYAQNPLGNYNIDRTNFYNGISATGYAISPLFEAQCEIKQNKLSVWINKIQAKIKKMIETNANPEENGVMTALIIGDKTGIQTELTADYRTAGLAHLLAISGMHMGMIALLVFFFIRLILLPFGGGYRDWRKPAAVLSLTVTFLYFLISGQSVSCIRAFVMTFFVLLAVFFNRRPISQRLWALAVIIVASINPSAVLSPGFLMSFMAVLGIISFYEKYASSIKKLYQARNIIGKIGIYFVGIIMTDLVASLMTLSYSIYYFNQISVYTTLGNVLAGPIVAFWVMPAIFLFLLSVPFGSNTMITDILAHGVKMINQIAVWVASLAGARSGEGIAVLSDFGIVFITFGILWLCIWQSKWRLWGIGLIVIGMSSLWLMPRADFVFAKDGQTYACRAGDGRLHKTPWHKNKFLTSAWTGKEEKTAEKDNGLVCNKKQCTCQKRIEFSKHQVKLDNKEVSLHQSGYISLKHGVIYAKPQFGRLWN